MQNERWDPPAVTYLPREGLTVEEVLGALAVLAAEVQPDLLQAVAVGHGAPGDVHQVLLVQPQGHMSPRVVHRPTDLDKVEKRN